MACTIQVAIDQAPGSTACLAVSACGPAPASAPAASAPALLERLENLRGSR